MKNILFYATISTILYLSFNKFTQENCPSLKTKIEQTVGKLYSPEFSDVQEIVDEVKEKVVSDMESTTYPNRNGGSAYKLEGNIAVVSVFLTDDTYRFGNEKDVMTKVNNAENWLKSKALEYGKTVNFSNFTYGKDVLVQFPTPEGWSNRGTHFAPFFALQKFDDSPMGIINFAKSKGCEQVVVLFITNGEGRSYAMDNYTSNSNVLDYDLIFAKNNVANEAQIAHEMLHLFGAVDLYPLQSQTSEKQSMLSNYRMDIMANVSNNLSVTQFSSFTAWSVGLTSDKYSNYDVLCQR
jgi:hypothetical protein